MTVRETYFCGKLPVFSREVKPDTTYTEIETEPVAGIPGFEDLGRFAYNESKIVITIEDEDTLSADVYPIVTKGYMEYMDLLPTVIQNPEERIKRFYIKEQIDDFPATQGRFKTIRRFSWKPGK